jgi:hypothetical protein
MTGWAIDLVNLHMRTECFEATLLRGEYSNSFVICAVRMRTDGGRAGYNLGDEAPLAIARSAVVALGAHLSRPRGPSK